jgi:hypothetical protein
MEGAVSGQYVHLEHRCNLPFILGNGDVWQCSDCLTFYRSVAPGNPDYAGWRKLGPFGRWLFGVKRASEGD